MTTKMWQAGLVTLVALTTSIMATPAMGTVFAEPITWNGISGTFEFPGDGVLNGAGAECDLSFSFSELAPVGVYWGAQVQALGAKGETLGRTSVYVSSYSYSVSVDLGWFETDSGEPISAPVKSLEITAYAGYFPLITENAIEGFYPANPLAASFMYTGYLDITFTDTSTPGPAITSWLWDFGGGATSSDKNPTHTYSISGVYTVTLTVKDTFGATDTTTATVTARLHVGVDVKPGSSPNTINLGANGVIPVAILSSPDFDALTVDPATVQLEGKAGVRAKGNGTYLTEQRDVNGDGRIDLIVKIETQNLDPSTIQDGLAEVTGQTTTTPPIFFKGVDEVTIVPQ